MTVHIVGKKPTKPVQATLVMFGGAKLALNIENPMDEFVYVGRFFALNAQFTEAAKHRVYVEINDQVVEEIRENSRRAAQIAERWAMQLASMKECKVPEEQKQ